VAIPAEAEDIRTAEAAQQAIASLTQQRELAVDVEADSMHHFRARLCFVQVGTEASIFLFDTLLEEVRTDVLRAPLEDPAITKYFHAAQGDLSYLAECGVRVRGLFDTHRAATLLGWQKLGLADLVKEHLGATLQKEHQQADFSLRPLPAELRAYIADDVRYLVTVGRIVRQACEVADILEEVQLDCDRLCAEAAGRKDISLDFTPKFSRQGLSAAQMQLAHHVAWQLHRLRLELAEAADVPMGRMLSNAAVSAIASKLPSSVKDLARLEGVRGAFVRAHGERVLQLVAEKKAEAEAGALPEVNEKKDRDPRRKKREEVLVEWRKRTAAERKLTPSVVLSNALVADLANRPPDQLSDLELMPFFGPKRVERYGARLLELLASHR
jgi:ribonuclease D